MVKEDSENVVLFFFPYTYNIHITFIRKPYLCIRFQKHFV